MFTICDQPNQEPRWRKSVHCGIYLQAVKTCRSPMICLGDPSQTLWEPGETVNQRSLISCQTPAVKSRVKGGHSNWRWLSGSLPTAAPCWCKVSHLCSQHCRLNYWDPWGLLWVLWALGSWIIYKVYNDFYWTNGSFSLFYKHILLQHKSD